MGRVIYDIEVYPNYMCLGFLFQSGKVKQYEAFGDEVSLKKKHRKKINKIIKENTLVGFNNRAYDDPVTTLILEGATTDVIYQASKFVVEDRVKRWEVYQQLNVEEIIKSIDLIEVAKGKASLKLYGARVHSKKIQDLPYDPHQTLNKEEAQEVKEYNVNDLMLTRDVYEKLLPKLNLREDIGRQYGINVMSKSDAQIAEAIFKEELSKVGVKAKRLASKKELTVDTTKKDLKRLQKRIIDESMQYNKDGKLIVPSAKERETIKKRYDIDVNVRVDEETMFSEFKDDVKELCEMIGNKEFPAVRYIPPERIKFEREDLTEIVKKIGKELIVLDGGGSPILPKWLENEVISIGTSRYNVGLGGLHSMEKSMVVIPEKHQTLGNVDVASYYPSLILSLKLFPKQLTETFLEVYSKIKATRLEAKLESKQLSKRLKELESEGNKDEIEQVKIELKRANTTNESLKTTINGSFGKYGSHYSFLYAPDLLLQITITGQLYLLMLIEQLEKNGFKVVSSNTDGVEILYDTVKQKELEKIVGDWEKLTEMEMEFGYYNGLYARDVNNYVAVYDGYTKAKGVYADPSLPENLMEKNSEYPIVFEAIRTFLLTGKPMKETIRECKDVTQFLTSTTVTGGAIFSDEQFPNTDEYENYLKNATKQNKALEKRNETYQKDLVLNSKNTKYLGKVVRWYYATNGNPIYRKQTGYKVGKSDGAFPMMELSENIPKNLDYEKYDELCDQYLADLGFN
jgi:DNA polymerase elongation subunit (family B)